MDSRSHMQRRGKSNEGQSVEQEWQGRLGMKEGLTKPKAA